MAESKKAFVVFSEFDTMALKVFLSKSAAESFAKGKPSRIIDEVELDETEEPSSIAKEPVTLQAIFSVQVEVPTTGEDAHIAQVESMRQNLINSWRADYNVMAILSIASLFDSDGSLISNLSVERKNLT